MIELPKKALHWSGLSQRKNHHGHLIGVSPLEDAGGITLRGLTMEIEIKAHVDAVSCKWLFTLYQSGFQYKVRLYQLEVSPRSKRSHNAKIPIYGSHEHYGELSVNAIDSPKIGCDNWAESLNYFFKTANIEPFHIDDPYHVQL